MNYIIIDQGTSSTKVFLFDNKGTVLYKNQIKHKINIPKPFNIEFDPLEVISAIKKLIFEVLEISKSINSVGLAIQRSTFLFWEKTTKKALTPAISWQDSRAEHLLKEFQENRKEIWQKTFTPLTPHFGGPKFVHIIRKNASLKQAVKNGDVYFGPLSAYITHSLTGQAFIDQSIASRSLLFNIKKGKWSKSLLDLFDVPLKCLPPITPVNFKFGNILKTKIPLSIVIGDQQAALIGQGGLKKDYLGANFGTSGSIQYNSGNRLLKTEGLISSVLFSKKNERIFMLEGTINACNGLFYHLENLLNISHNEMQWNVRSRGTTTNGVFIPGFNGLASPYWVSGFNDIFIDLPNNHDQIIRAAMESIGFLTNDIITCLKEAEIVIPNKVLVSGGGARPTLLQFISNITRLEIRTYKMKDKTAIGVYKLLNRGHEAESKENLIDKVFYPSNYKKAHTKVLKWNESLKNNNFKKKLF